MAKFAVEKTLADVMATSGYVLEPSDWRFLIWKREDRRISVGHYPEMATEKNAYFLVTWYGEEAWLGSPDEVEDELWETIQWN